MGREGNHRCCFISSKPFVMAGVDSGLVVVFTIIVFLVVVMMTTLVYVKYEWCHVLFKNNTENPACTKNFLRDNIRLTSGEA